MKTIDAPETGATSTRSSEHGFSAPAWTAEEEARQEGRTAVGDLSKAELPQLFCLFDAADAAHWAWQAGLNQPRAGQDGHIADILDHEASRGRYIARAVVEELMRRGAVGKDYAAARAAILAKWFAYTGAEDEDVYREVLRELAAAAPRADAAPERPPNFAV